MKLRTIKLEDGTTIDLKVNFLTTMLMYASDMEEWQKKSDNEKQKKKPDESKIRRLDARIMCEMVYIMLRSSGLEVTRGDALMLCPPNTDEVMEAINEYSEAVAKEKKKEDMKM